jgi:hypothetical protein
LGVIQNPSMINCESLSVSQQTEHNRNRNGNGNGTPQTHTSPRTWPLTSSGTSGCVVDVAVVTYVPSSSILYALQCHRTHTTHVNQYVCLVACRVVVQVVTVSVTYRTLQKSRCDTGNGAENDMYTTSATLIGSLTGTDSTTRTSLMYSSHSLRLSSSQMKLKMSAALYGNVACVLTPIDCGLVSAGWWR